MRWCIQVLAAKSIINEQPKQKSYQSNGSANLNISTQDAHNIKNENNKINLTKYINLFQLMVLLSHRMS